MKLEYFRFLDVVKDKNTKLKHGGAFSNGPRDMFEKMANSSRLLIFSKQFLDKIPLNKKNFISYEPLAIPFSSVWIETDSANLFESGQDNETKTCIKGLLLYETTDSDVFVIILYNNDDIRFGFLNEPTITNHPELKNLYSFLKALFDQLHHKDTACGEEHTNLKARVGSGKNRELVKIKTVVRITLKNNKKDCIPIAGGTIDWSHRWEVRGHWRKITGIGKNRQGQYLVKGLTWVTPFQKGPKEKPFVKKSRVTS